MRCGGLSRKNTYECFDYVSERTIYTVDIKIYDIKSGRTKYLLLL